MNIVLYIIFGLQIFLSCSSQYSPTSELLKPEVTHKYELSIVDLGDIPIEGIRIIYSLKDSATVKTDSSHISLPDSSLHIWFKPIPSLKFSSLYFTKYYSTLEYELELQNRFYYSGDESIISAHHLVDNSIANNEIRKTKIVLSKHNFQLDFRDIEGSPILNSQVEYEMKCNENVISQKSVLTNKYGSISDFVYEYIEKNETSSNSNCSLSYSIENEYYYSNSGIIAPSSKWETNISRKIILFKSIDYLEEGFYANIQNSELLGKLLKVVDNINLDKLDDFTLLRTQSIRIVSFKEKPFLRFAFKNISYSLMDSKYDIGKKIFDDLIRRLINLNSKTLEESNQFYGYDLSVTSILILDVPKFREIEYRFIIPKDIAKKYANKDITGQKMLDSSVILMDGERIELKLQ